MGSINWARVVLGGLLAGVVINLGEMICGALLFQERWEAAIAALGVTAPSGPGAMTIWILYGFALGIALVWLYAAIRPRYGAGPKTAIIAGLAVWFLSYFLWGVSLCNMGLLPSGLLVGAGIVGLVEVLVAALLGGWLYKEA